MGCTKSQIGRSFGFWDGRTVPGEVVNIGAELVRRYV